MDEEKTEGHTLKCAVYEASQTESEVTAEEGKDNSVKAKEIKCSSYTELHGGTCVLDPADLDPAVPEPTTREGLDLNHFCTKACLPVSLKLGDRCISWDESFGGSKPKLEGKLQRKSNLEAKFSTDGTAAIDGEAPMPKEEADINEQQLNAGDSTSPSASGDVQGPAQDQGGMAGPMTGGGNPTAQAAGNAQQAPASQLHDVESNDTMNASDTENVSSTAKTDSAVSAGDSEVSEGNSDTQESAGNAKAKKKAKAAQGDAKASTSAKKSDQDGVDSDPEASTGDSESTGKKDDSDLEDEMSEEAASDAPESDSLPPPFPLHYLDQLKRGALDRKRTLTRLR